MTVTVYLSTPLFTFGGSTGHAPEGSMALVGTLVEPGASGGVTVAVTRFLDNKGRILSGVPRTLFVPMGKVDHVVHGGS